MDTPRPVQPVGLIGLPRLASALSAAGLTVIGGGEDLRHAVPAIRDARTGFGYFPVLASDREETGLGTWLNQAASSGARVVIAHIDGEAPIVQVAGAKRVAMPCLLADLISALGYPVDGLPTSLREAFVDHDGHVEWSEPESHAAAPAAEPEYDHPVPGFSTQEIEAREARRAQETQPPVQPAQPAPAAPAAQAPVAPAEAPRPLAAESYAPPPPPWETDRAALVDQPTRPRQPLPNLNQAPSGPGPAQPVQTPAQGPVHPPASPTPSTSPVAPVRPVDPATPQRPAAPVQPPAQPVQPTWTQTPEPYPAAPHYPAPGTVEHQPSASSPYGPPPQAPPSAPPPAYANPRPQQPPAAHGDVPGGYHPYADQRGQVSPVEQDMFHADPSYQRRSGIVVVVWSGKGGVGKTTTAASLAQRFAAITGGRATLVDSNYGQGDQRMVINLPKDHRSIYDCALSARNGQPPSLKAGLLTPTQIAELRGEQPVEVRYGLLAAPPPQHADLRVVTPSLYLEMTEQARQMSDMVVIDTQIVESDSNDPMVAGFLTPLLRNGDTWQVALSDESRMGIANLFQILNRFQQSGAPSNRCLSILNRVPGRAQFNEAAVERGLAQFGTYLGSAGMDNTIHRAMNAGQPVADNPTIAPLLDAVLNRITGDQRFNAHLTYTAPAQRAADTKRKGAWWKKFGGRK